MAPLVRSPGERWLRLGAIVVLALLASAVAYAVGIGVVNSSRIAV
ncbi:MAG: hypothetical protein OZ948_08490 [Deltaproteobacteria bacterium]|nr:hypothetical protein [Deltaproteobacteria bacterium]